MKPMKKKAVAILLVCLMLVGMAGCGASESDLVDELGLTADSKDATESTQEVNSAIYSLLDFEDTQEAEFAVQGLIDAPENLELTDSEGNVVWSQKAYAFLDDYEEAPDTVNPSL